MKTYPIVALLLMGLSFVACEKSNDATSEEFPPGTTANYTVFLKGNNRLYTQLLRATADGLALKEEASAFVTGPSESLKFSAAGEISFYTTTNCDATVQVYNAITDKTRILEVFKDLNVCTIEVTAIAHTSEYVLLSYIRELEGKERQFTLRYIPLASDGQPFLDIPLDKKPIELMPSSSRLFVLTQNEFVTDEFHLSVFDMTSKERLIELDLGYNAKKLFKNNAGDLIISYPELHTLLNASTLDKKYTMYGDNTEPGFISTKDSFMDSYGRLYFQKTIPTARVETVPASYDFEKNNTVVYLYENFLTETELTVKYNIAATTTIGYDEQNDVVLIGYQKNGPQGKGGILRISPAPDFKLLDNIDLEAVPQSIFVN